MRSVSLHRFIAKAQVVLLSYIHSKSPVNFADSLRALGACMCLSCCDLAFYQLEYLIYGSSP